LYSAVFGIGVLYSNPGKVCSSSCCCGCDLPTCAHACFVVSKCQTGLLEKSSNRPLRKRYWLFRVRASARIHTADNPSFSNRLLSDFTVRRLAFVHPKHWRNAVSALASPSDARILHPMTSVIISLTSSEKTSRPKRDISVHCRDAKEFVDDSDLCLLFNNTMYNYSGWTTMVVLSYIWNHLGEGQSATVRNVKKVDYNNVPVVRFRFNLTCPKQPLVTKGLKCFCELGSSSFTECAWNQSGISLHKTIPTDLTRAAKWFARSIFHRPDENLFE